MKEIDAEIERDPRETNREKVEATGNKNEPLGVYWYETVMNLEMVRLENTQMLH